MIFISNDPPNDLDHSIRQIKKTLMHLPISYDNELMINAIKFLTSAMTILHLDSKITMYI